MACLCFRSPMAFSRATQTQRCGSSSVWAMLSCFVPSSSSWGACFFWRPLCFSWTTGRELSNSKWLTYCLSNSSLCMYYLVIHSLNIWCWPWVSSVDFVSKTSKVQKKCSRSKKVDSKSLESCSGQCYGLSHSHFWQVSGTNCAAMPTMMPAMQDWERPQSQ